MRQVMLALACLATGWEAAAGELHGIELRKQDDIVRLLLESEPGTLKDVGFAEDGKALVIDLAGVDKAVLDKLVAGLGKDHPLIKGIRVLPLGDRGREGSRLVVDLRWRADVLDETIASIGNDRSRWEIVLTKHRPPAGVLEGLAGLEVEEGKDGPVLVLKGAADLRPQVQVLDKPPRLVVDLPSVDPFDATPVAAQFQADHPLLQGVVVQPAAKGSRLVFGLAGPVKLGSSTRALIEGGTSVRVSLLPQGSSPAALGARFEALKISEAQGKLTLALSGATGFKADIAQLGQPPRLAIRLQGIDVQRLGELVGSFRSTHPAILGVRLGKVGRRSADLLVDFAWPLELESQVVEPAQNGQGGGLLVALKLPMSVASPAPLPPVAAPVPPAPPAAGAPALDMRIPPEASGPLPRIRPIQLGRDAAPSRAPAPGVEAPLFGLLQAYDRALESDPKYKVAKAEYNITQESLPQARAGYLPTATFDYQRGRNRLEVLSGPASYRPGSQTYSSNGNTLTITQPILKASAYVKMEQAQVSIEQSKLALLAAEQELMVRLSAAYLTMLAAQDGLELARAEQEVTRKQYELARSRLESGLGTLTQLHETEARHALTEAREIDAQNKLEDARVALKEIVGVDVGGLQPFAGDFEASMPQPAQVEPWVSAALEQNLSLQARNLSTEIAALEVRRQQAGYLPTLNLVVSRGEQESGGTLFGAGSHTRSGEVGLRFSMPLFEGGMTNSLVREAVARKDRALQERDQEYRKTERLAHSSLLAVVSSARTLGALKKSVAAQESALAAKQEGFRSGLQTIVAVVDAYRLYYAAKRDHLQARYDHVLNRLKLKQAVGALSRSDLDDVAQLLKQ